MNSRKIVVALASLLLSAFAMMPLAAATAKAATTVPARQAAAMGVTSSGQIINLARPPSWLRPNTLVHPLNYISPDTLSYNVQLCDADDQCINDWDNGGAGTLLRFYADGVTYNYWNWWYEGTVSGEQSWPFTGGTGINNAYPDQPVYKFAYAPNNKGTGNCMNQTLFTSGSTSANLNTAGCTCSTCQLQASAKEQYFVLAGNDNYRLIAVGATDTYVAATGNDSNRVWVGVFTSDNNGKFVALTTTSGNSLRGWSAHF